MTLLPYPVPSGWRLTSAPPGSRASAIASLVAAGVAGGVALWRATVGDGLGTLIVSVVFVVIALVSAGTFEMSGSERGSSVLMNAVTITRPGQRPPDDWVHFFRDRPPRLWFATMITVAGLAGTAGTIVAMVIVEDDFRIAVLIIGGLFLLATAFLLIAGSIILAARWRLSSFGRHHVGYSVGRTGFTRFYLDATDTFAWDDITELRAHVKVHDEDTGDFSPYLLFTADGEEQEFPIGDNEAHAYVIYCAAMHWWTTPEGRDELGTTFAQRRIEEWATRVAEAAPQ